MAPDQTANILAEPNKIDKLTLRNRIVMDPMAASAPTKDGGPSEQTLAFFEARAGRRGHDYDGRCSVEPAHLRPVPFSTDPANRFGCLYSGFRQDCHGCACAWVSRG